MLKNARGMKKVFGKLHLGGSVFTAPQNFLAYFLFLKVLHSLTNPSLKLCFIVICANALLILAFLALLKCHITITVVMS